MLRAPSPFSYVPQRSTQPYRQGVQLPGPALTAMMRGRTFSNQNPIDSQRGSTPVPGSLLALLLGLSPASRKLPYR